MMQEVNILEEIFLNEMWGILGPMGLVIIGYFLAKEKSYLGVLWFVVELYIVGQYLELVDTTLFYWWHIFILLLGGIFACVFPLLNRWK